MHLQDLFGSMVFNDNVMHQRLPKETYTALHRTISEGKRLPPEVASVVANTMKDWAIEKGVTHYTHWFQPMTGITAEKHDSFLSPVQGGSAIMEFSGKELVRGEPDASSLPSGGLRATFEARGYTAWDPTSYAFIKDNTLFIPTAFCSYGGQALDKKTPLLRSMDSLNRQALRILRLFGNNSATHVNSTVGPEQEYFLIDRKLYLQRKDLLYCDRTLYGARPPKGQELDDHYFGSIKPRVSSFMRDLDEELWKLGVASKTEHNETAPAQHEMASIYQTNNIATDHNQLTMDLMKKVAEKHDLACLLHEKPFAGINGSGKHNNWSMATTSGTNLLEPGDTPEENMQFLLFLLAVIRAVDEHQDLLRISVASAGNDHRLGASEAPPAIISIFLGDELTEILSSLENHCNYQRAEACELNIGVHALPRLSKDISDRNRTSPLAFTGNKFEFRMVGAPMSIADPNVALNTIVADVLMDFADTLEAAPEFKAACDILLVDTIKKHKRIIFNGNNYASEWVEEAARRGLLNLKSVPDAIPYYIREENVALFARQRVFSREEILSRYDIMLENYCKVMNIEAYTMLDMARKQILPAVIAFSSDIAKEASLKKSVLPDSPLVMELKLLKKLDSLLNGIFEKIEALHASLRSVDKRNGVLSQAHHYRDNVFPAMQELRSVADEAETTVAESTWPFPTYGMLLTLR